jgi:hypothetical protein
MKRLYSSIGSLRSETGNELVKEATRLGADAGRHAERIDPDRKLEAFSWRAPTTHP